LVSSQAPLSLDEWPVIRSRRCLLSRLPHVLGITTVLAILALSGLSCGGNDSNPMNPGGGGGGADKTITILGSLGAGSYSPAIDTVTVGQTVAWHNADGTTHTATANGGAFNTGNVGGGGTSAAIAMGTPGSFPYHCTIHGLSMAGTLVVVVP
jgi:plastocyanin